MVSVGKKHATTTDVSVPNLRQVVDPSNGEGGESATKATLAACIDGLTRPLTDQEKYSGEFELPANPRIMFTGTYEEALKFLEGDLSRWTETAGVAEYTDGSPVALPTEGLVAEMLKGTSHKPDEVVGPIGPSLNPATVESVAVNGVMAGCKPEYMPVLLALTEAMSHTDIAEALFGANSWFRFGAVVNGPIAKEIGLNHGGPLHTGPAPLTPAVPANTTIGRFIRLMMVNVGEIVAGVNEAKGTGNPAKNSFVVTENIEESPWPQMSTDYGFKDGENTVTFFIFWGGMLGGHRGRYNGPPVPASEKVFVDTLGAMTASIKGLERCNQGLVLNLSTEQALALANAGYSRQDVKQWLSDHIVDPFKVARDHGVGVGVVGTLYSIMGVPITPSGDWPPEWKDPNFDQNTIVKYYPNPDAITIVVWASSYSPVMNGTPRWTVAIDKWK